MIEKTQYLLGNCSNELNVEGNPCRAVASYFTHKKMNTIFIHTNESFKGRIYLYGSLAVNPTENDWVNIPLSYEKYLEFDNKKRENCYLNIYGNYVWLKAKLDRSYLDLEKYSIVQPTYKSTHIITRGNIFDEWGHNMTTIEKESPIKYSSRLLGNLEKMVLVY